MCTPTYDLLTDTSFRQAGIFNHDIVAALLDEHVREVDNHGSEILALVMFEIERRELHEGRGAHISHAIAT